MNEAYAVGQLEAATSFGLEKTAGPRLMGALLGGAMGMATAPEGDWARGAAVGAGLGLGVGAGAGALGKWGAGKMQQLGVNRAHGQALRDPRVQLDQLKNDAVRQEQLFRDTARLDRREYGAMARADAEVAQWRKDGKLPQGPVPSPVPQPPSYGPVPQHVIDASRTNGTDPALVWSMMNAPRPAGPSPVQPPVSPQPVQPAPVAPAPPPTPAAPAAPAGPWWTQGGAAPTGGIAGWQPNRMPAAPAPAAPAAPAGLWWTQGGAAPAGGIANWKGAGEALDAFGVKQADWGVSVGIPGLGFQGGSKDEMLPGMHKWVPRGVIERAHEMRDMGFDNQAIVESEQERGSLLHPLLGSAAGAALAHFGLPQGGVAAPVLGGLMGGGFGALFNQATARGRGEDAREALQGVDLQRTEDQVRQNRARLLQGQQHTTASENTPLVVARGEH